MSDNPVKPIVIEVPDDAPGRSTGKTIAIIAVLLVMIGGLGFLAILLFSGDEKLAVTDANEVTPEAAVKGWYDALGNNQPQVLWSALPEEHHQKAVNGFKMIGAAVGDDQELYERGLKVAGNFARVLSTKKKMLVGLIAYHDKQKEKGGSGMQGVLGAVTSLADAYKDGGANGPDLGKLGKAVQGIAGNQLDPAGYLGGLMKENDVKPWKFEATYGMLEVILDSKIKDVGWLKDPNVNEFVAETGPRLMKHLDQLGDQEAKESWGKGFKEPIRAIKVTRTSWKEDGDSNTATVQVECPPIPFLELEQAGVAVFELARADGRWRITKITKGHEVMFGRLIQGTEMTADKVSDMAMFRLAQAQIRSLSKSDKREILGFLDTVDGYITKVDQIQSAEELAEMAREAILGPFMSHLGGLAGATGLPNPGGANPVNPKPNLPNPGGGLSGTIPATPAGLNKEWVVWGETPPRLRLDNRGYFGKSQAFVERIFGKPDEVAQATAVTDPPTIDPRLRAESYLIYKSLNVVDGRPGKNQAPMKSVAFGFQKGQLVKILAQ